MADVPLATVAAEIPEVKDPKGYDANKDKSVRTTATDRNKDVHAEALERYELGYEKDRKNQDMAYEDLRFLSEEGQWEAKAKQEREAEGRPILVVNKTPQFIRQVTGDIRQLRPAIKVVPVDDAASQEVATKILPGMIRYIEQRSDAKGAYFSAADQQVGGGIGHCRVYCEISSDKTLEQEICIGQVEDGISVVWDPDAIHPTRKDAMWCFVPIDMSRKAFERRWPEASADPLTESKELFYTWFTDDHVRVTEYWRKCPIMRRLAIYPTGPVIDLTDDEDGTKQADVDAFNARIDLIAQQAQATGQLPTGPGAVPPPKVEIEERPGFQVERYVISARDILEGPELWPGMQIPIVPFLGEETKIGREIIRKGVVRNLKDVQRIYNYAVSMDTESVALQPKAPFIGTRKQFEKYQDQWETANSRNWPYLEYEPDEKAGGPPQRVQPPVASSGIRDLLAMATGDMSAVTGIYPASLGQASNESSGKAILARQREGDTGTYVYIEAFGRALQRIGEIIIDLIPHIYDTKRTIRIVGEDGKIDSMPINQEVIDPNGDGIATVMLNDLTVGAYEVVIEMGPSYATKKEEARDGMQQFMQAAGPQTAQLYIDLFAKMQDWPLSDKIAKRAQSLLPPNIQQLEAQDAGEPPPPPVPPPPPPPEVQMKMAEMQQNQQFKQQELALKSKEIEAEFARINADLETSRRSHEAAMAGHALELHKTRQTGPGGLPSAPNADARVDALADAVQHLNAVVVEIANTLGLTGSASPNGGGGPVPPSSPPPPPTETSPPVGAPAAGNQSLQ